MSVNQSKIEVRLNCTKCGAFREYESEDGSKNVVRCASCGKRHSTESLHGIYPSRIPYRRDEAGELIESTP